MIIVLLTVLGLCFGSFVNALVWRLHEQQEIKIKSRSLKGKKAPTKKDLSIIKGHSMCPDCHHALAWYDLLPVISWLYLRGKCRYCHKPIGWQYPFVEIITTALFILSYTFWPISGGLPPMTFHFVFWLMLIIGFVALAVYDLRWMLLPNRIVFPLQILAGIYAAGVIVMMHGSRSPAIRALILSVLCSAGLFYVIFQVSKGKWIGGGDVKLAVVLGLVLGSPAKAVLMLFIASLIGSCISLPLLVMGKFKRTSRMPFGPLLIIGTIIVYIFGASLIAWYKQKLLLT